MPVHLCVRDRPTNITLTNVVRSIFGFIDVPGHSESTYPVRVEKTVNQRGVC